MVTCGDCFRLPWDKIPDEKRHLHAVITDVDASGNVLVVYLNRATEDSPVDLVIQPGQETHDFITKPTVINYGDCRWPMSSEAIERKIHIGRIIRDGSLHPTLLKRVQETGLTQSCLAVEARALIAVTIAAPPPFVRTLQPRRR